MTITYPNGPKDVCIRLGGAAAANFGRVAVGNDTAPVAIVDTFADSSDTVDEAALTESCLDEGSTMVFTSN